MPISITASCSGLSPVVSISNAMMVFFTGMCWGRF
jgi:hypothetical protein